MSFYEKDPAARLDYSVNWGPSETDPVGWLAGDTIADSDWIVPTGINLEMSPAPSHTATTATCWLSGGTVGETYTVTCRITTAAGRTDDRSIRLFVTER